MMKTIWKHENFDENKWQKIFFEIFVICFCQNFDNEQTRTILADFDDALNKYIPVDCQKYFGELFEKKKRYS